MRRGSLALGLLLLGACSRRSDLLIAEARSPLHVAVRARRSSAGSCSSMRGFDYVTCVLGKRPTNGCVYIEVGDPAPQPADAQLCGVAYDQRSVRVISEEYEHTAELHVDAIGERVAVRLGDNNWLVLYVEGGVVLHVEAVDGTVPFDWHHAPTFDERLPIFISGVPEGAQATRLAERMKAGGEPRLEAFLVNNVNTSAWEQIYGTLSREGQARVRARLAALLDAPATPELDLAPQTWSFLVEHPALRPADFGERVERLERRDLAHGEVDDNHQWVFEELVREGNPHTGELACEALRLALVARTMADYAASQVVPTAVLATLMHTRAPCPWLTTWITDAPCAALLCQSESDEQGNVLTHLCTPEEARESLASWEQSIVRPVPEPVPLPDGGEPDEPPTPVDEALLLGALLAQGPLPPAIKTRLERRDYVVATPRGSLDSEDLDEACRTVHQNEQVNSAACGLPATETGFTWRGCRVRFDDAQRRLVLSDVDPPPKVAAPPK
jgi:hypothetical protein